MEDNHVYEIFEDLMKSLIIHRPKEPVKFLLDKLNDPESKLLNSSHVQEWALN